VRSDVRAKKKQKVVVRVGEITWENKREVRAQGKSRACTFRETRRTRQLAN
jgi:hypothetical protein